MSIGTGTYELEKLMEFRQRELAERVERNLLRAARRWVIQQSMVEDREARLSRAAGGRV